MTTTYTPVFRLPVMTPGDPAVKDSWGAVLSAMMALIEQGAVGQIAVSINGLTTYSLTTANDATDQARYLSQQYTGALSGTCTVTMPNVNKVGWAQNSTTGGQVVVLTAGAGTTATLPPDGNWYFYWCDGATNVSLVHVGFSALRVQGSALIVQDLEVQGDVTAAGGIVGTTTNDSAGAGIVGEYISSTVLVGGAVPLTTSVSANVTSISLTAGDWDVWGNVFAHFSGTPTNFPTLAMGISQTSATLPTAPASGAATNVFVLGATPTYDPGQSAGQIRISLATTTTIYLVVEVGWDSVAPCAAYGFIGARRRR